MNQKREGKRVQTAENPDNSVQAKGKENWTISTFLWWAERSCMCYWDSQPQVGRMGNKGNKAQETRGNRDTETPASIPSRNKYCCLVWTQESILPPAIFWQNMEQGRLCQTWNIYVSNEEHASREVSEYAACWVGSPGAQAFPLKIMDNKEKEQKETFDHWNPFNCLPPPYAPPGPPPQLYEKDPPEEPKGGGKAEEGAIPSARLYPKRNQSNVKGIFSKFPLTKELREIAPHMKPSSREDRGVLARDETTEEV